MQWKNRTTRVLLLALGIPLLIAAIAFGYWTISPLFIDVEVHEALSDAGVMTLREGGFVGADEVAHRAQGRARIVETGAGEVLVRFEDDFSVSNGPDLYVYLVNAGGLSKGYLDLGRLKGNIGSQSYPLPADTDLSQYESVIVWCKAFGVLFGTADLL